MEWRCYYHRPESEFAFIFIRIETSYSVELRKGDIESIILHYGDPLSLWKCYPGCKEMAKITSIRLTDRRVEVLADFAYQPSLNFHGYGRSKICITIELCGKFSQKIFVLLEMNLRFALYT